MSTVKDILGVARTVVAATPTSADASKNFLLHTSIEPFEKSPSLGADGFEIVAKEPKLTQGFGIGGSKVGSFYMIVKLGHSGNDDDNAREDNVQQDIARLADILEANNVAWPSGINAVFYEVAETKKELANWWITEMKFRVEYIGLIQS